MGLGEVMSCQGGSAGSATAGWRHGQVPTQAHTCCTGRVMGFGVLSKVDTERLMKALTGAKMQMLMGL